MTLPTATASSSSTRARVGQQSARMLELVPAQNTSGAAPASPQQIAGIVRDADRDRRPGTIDPGRVFVAGLSSGGAMAAILAACYPDLFVAMAVHSGLAFRSATDLASAFEAMARGAGRAEPRRSTSPSRDRRAPPPGSEHRHPRRVPTAPSLPPTRSRFCANRWPQTISRHPRAATTTLRGPPRLGAARSTVV